jgi:hypothetical protein
VRSSLKEARPGTGGIDGGLPFYGRSGAATVIQNHPGYPVVATRYSTMVRP